MSDLVYFTLTGWALGIAGDSPDVDTEPETFGIDAGIVISASVGLDVIRSQTLAPNPALLVLQDVPAKLTSGQVYQRQNQAGVRLVANCPALNLGSNDLLYTVSFVNPMFHGASASLPAITFVAPDEDVVIDLATVDRVGSISGGIAIQIVPGASVDDVQIVDEGPPQMVQFFVLGVPIGNPLELSISGGGGGGGDMDGGSP